MMKGLGALLIIGLLLFLAAFVIWSVVIGPAIEHRRQRRAEERDRNAPWKVTDDVIGQATQVMLVKPGEDPLYVGKAIPITLPAWEHEELLIEARIDAQAKADAKNRRLPV